MTRVAVGVNELLIIVLFPPTSGEILLEIIAGFQLLYVLLNPPAFKFSRQILLDKRRQIFDFYQAPVFLILKIFSCATLVLVLLGVTFHEALQRPSIQA